MIHIKSSTWKDAIIIEKYKELRVTDVPMAQHEKVLKAFAEWQQNWAKIGHAMTRITSIVGGGEEYTALLPDIEPVYMSEKISNHVKEIDDI